MGAVDHLKMSPHFSPGQPFQRSAVVLNCPPQCSGIILDQGMNTLAVFGIAFPMFLSYINSKNNVISIKTNVILYIEIKGKYLKRLYICAII